jgi:hypothetical protein
MKYILAFFVFIFCLNCTAQSCSSGQAITGTVQAIGIFCSPFVSALPAGYLTTGTTILLLSSFTLVADTTPQTVYVEACGT